MSPSPHFDGRLGARPVPGGVRFALDAAPGGGARLLLFPDADAALPDRVIELDPQRDRHGRVWSVVVPDAGPGQCYNWVLTPPGAVARPVQALLDPRGLGVAGWNRYDRQALRKLPDNTPVALRSVVLDPDAYDWGDDAPPRTVGREFIYEVHAAAFTADPSSGLAPDLRGTYAGLAARADHLVELGVTAVELLPVAAYDPLDAPAGRRNYWGYSPLSWFAPHPLYARDPDPARVLDEFRDMVRALHAAGLKVYVDVVYNHTAEAGADGPELSWRGCDEDGYYLRDAATGRYRDYTGCGNTISANHPVGRRLILDSLRWWVRHLHVDGFRFDLGATHVRDVDGAPLARPPLIGAMEADPVLADTRLIAEPWDTGGLHLVGDFPGDRFAVWNGPFRDAARRFLKGDAGVIEELMARIVGSPDLLGRPGATAADTINFVTCHDGFTLHDLVSYERKHNEANGEANRDGSDANLSWNGGVEGPSDDPELMALRERRVRNFLVLLFLSHGVPMLCGGDEWGQTRRGNNNPWCQDNDLNWHDWSLARTNAGLVAFTRRLARLANHHPVLARRRFWSATGPGHTGDIAWHGREPGRPDWSPTSRHLAWEIVEPTGGAHLLVAMNSEPGPTTFHLPAPPAGKRWLRLVDTADAAAGGWCEPACPEPAAAAVAVATHGVMVWLAQS
ncbi:glycogen debranching enzyme [bacterium]|nr:glycogen debranching enzyme [bacterium]